MTCPKSFLRILTMLACLTPASVAAEFSQVADRDRIPRRPFIRPRENLIPPDIQTDEHRAWYRHVQAETRRGTWLGVQLSPVPAALAAHLRVNRGAVMVRNVFGDSPADEAGLDRYDVIVEADGELIEDGLAAFSKYVRDKKPGDVLELLIYHEGEKQNRTIELVRRPADWTRLELKYEDDPDVSLKRRFGLRGKILRPGPDGWELKDLGEIPALHHLYHYLDPYAEPFSDEAEIVDEALESYAHNAEIDELRRVDKEGRVLHVRCREDGTVVVKRYRSKDGEDKAEIKTYDSMEELKRGDPEAYGLLQSACPTPGFADRYEDAIREYREALRNYRDAARKHAEVLRKYLEKHPWSAPGADDKWREWSERFFQGPLKDLKDSKKLRRFFEPGPESVEPAPGPSTRFEVSPTGEITVHVRNEDGELSLTFESKEAFKEKAPELYERFEELQKQVR